MMKIKKLLTLTLILISNIPLIFAFTLFFTQQKESIHNDVINKLNSIASIQHNRIRQLIISKKEAVNLITSRTQLRLSLNNYKEKDKIQRIIKDIKESTKTIQGITLYSKNKLAIYSTNNIDKKTNPEITQDNSKLSETHINMKIKRNINNVLITTFFETLYLKNELIGFISINFYSDELLNILTDYEGLGYSGEMVLASKNKLGNAQFLTPTRHDKTSDLNIVIPKENTEIPITHAINGTSAVLKDYKDYRNIPVLAISRHIPETDWGMIIKIDYDEAFHHIHKLQFQLGQFIILFFILTIILSFYISKKLSAPICRLELIANSVQEGSTNLKAPQSKIFEINQLAISFNSMVSSLLNAESTIQDSLQEVTELYTDLSSETERFNRWKESNFIGIIHSNENGKIFSANKAILNMLGYSEVEFKNHEVDWKSITPKEYLHLDEAAIKEAKIKGFWTPFEKEYIHKEGHRVPISIGGSIFKYDTNEFIVFIVDLTDRNHQIYKLSNYKNMIEAASDLYAFIDINYKFETVNSAFLKSHHLNKNQVINKNLPEVLGLSIFRETIKPSVDRALSGQTVNLTECYNLTHDNKLHINSTYTPYKNEKGHIIGIIYRGEDITQLEKQKQLVALHVAEQEQIVSSMLEGIITTDHIGNILSFNPEAESIFGYKQNEILTKNISILMQELDSDTHIDLMLAYERYGVSSFIGNRLGRDVIALHKDRHTFPLRIAVAHLPNTTGSDNHFIANCQDLTESEHQKEILNRSLKMESLGKVAGGIAHDFNNILGIASGYSELMLEHKSNSQDTTRYLNTILNACERGNKLTKSLLAFSKSKSTTSKPICINSIIKKNKEMLQTLLTNKIVLELKLDDSLSLALVDESLFEDMQLNLAINAMQAMDSGGKLTIETCNKFIESNDSDKLNLISGNYVKLKIKDTGCGISPKILSKIFDPFFTTKGDIGNGLGLSQCYGFVKSSKGTIDVKSKVNRGTTFNIYFPEFIPKETINYKKSDKNKTINNTYDNLNYSILILDDDKDILKLNAEFLSSKGVKVFCHSDPIKALETLKINQINFIVTDVIMPKMGGVEFIKKAKQIVPDIKYLYVSGFVNVKNSDEANEIKPILYKPYKKSELIEAITFNYSQS